jgi:hypothetical protein
MARRYELSREKVKWKKIIYGNPSRINFPEECDDKAVSDSLWSVRSTALSALSKPRSVQAVCQAVDEGMKYPRDRSRTAYGLRDLSDIARNGLHSQIVKFK